MGFSEELKAVSRDIWRRELEHPFVTGLGDSTLDPACFQFYLEQDYRFLVDYAKVFAYATTKATDVETMAAFARLCADTLHEEMALHRSYCAEFGITPEALETVQPALVTRGYTEHLLNVAASGSLAEIIAAVLPCQWGYAEVARHLRDRGMPSEPRYRKWIEMYSSAEFEDYGKWLRECMDTMADDLTQESQHRLKALFHASSHWELLFWEMAWRRESGVVAEP
jgi:thiaminase/transcriptional activator TenA